MDSNTVTYRRSDLYERVWKDPVCTVARAYGISDVWLAKICRRLSVPLPGRGYWARIKAGWPKEQPPLAPLPDGRRSEITVPRRRQQVFLSRVLRSEHGDYAKPPAIEVPERLDRPHKLVSDAARLLRGRDASDGYVSCWGVPCLKVQVTKSTLGRALRIMHALLKSLEDRQYQVEVTRVWTDDERQRYQKPDIPNNATRVLVSGEWIEFGIFEKATTIRETTEPPKGLKGSALESWLLTSRPVIRHKPSGQLELKILNCEYLGIRRTRGDGKYQTIEKGLGAFVVDLEVAAEALKQQRLERERRHREWEEKRRTEEEARARAREEAEKEKRLGNQITHWRLARDAREYVAEARQLLASDVGETTEENVAQEWLAWVESFADRIDPMKGLLAKVRGPSALVGKLEEGVPVS